VPLPTPTQVGDLAAQLNESFTLKFGQRAVFSAPGNPRVAATTLLEDSRCPMDTNCMAVGTARVMITVESGDPLRAARFDLSLRGTDLRGVGAFDGYVVKLVNVEPVPLQMGKTIPLSDYKITLRMIAKSLAVPQARLNEYFTLKLGQAVDFSDAPLRLLFDSVQQDSRCPLRAFCVTSGAAVLNVILSHDGIDERYAVQVGGKGTATNFPIVQTFTGAVYAIALTPYPQVEMASKEIAPSEYQATFVVPNPLQPYAVLPSR